MGFFLAFRRGSPHDDYDNEIMLGINGEIVHCEILVKDGPSLVSFGAWKSASPSFQARDPYTWMPHQRRLYSFLELPIPLAKYNTALKILQAFCDAQLEYAMGWYCVLPKCLVPGKDLDPMPPDFREWKAVFCSQIALLFLKQCVLKGVLARESKILAQDSRCCSPTDLFRLVQPVCRLYSFPEVFPAPKAPADHTSANDAEPAARPETNWPGLASAAAGARGRSGWESTRGAVARRDRTTPGPTRARSGGGSWRYPSNYGASGA